MNYTKELNRLGFTKKNLSVIPNRLKFRTARLFYDYQSTDIKGIDIVVPYLEQYNLKFFLNTKDLIGWNIFFFGEYERNTNQLLKKYIKPDDVVLEAGANNGSETLLIAKLVGSGMVHVFEPIPHVYKRLFTNMELNNVWDKVKLYDLALGDEDKVVQFNIMPPNFCNQGMSSKYGENDLTTKLDVKQKKVDTWVRENNIKRLNFIKMDIQGAEIDLLTGAEETIQRFKPVIFTEASDSWNSTINLYNQLNKMGYKVFLITPGQLKSLDTESNIVDGDWLCFHKESDWVKNLNL